MELRSREVLQAIVDKRIFEVGKTTEELQARIDKRLKEIKERK